VQYGTPPRSAGAAAAVAQEPQPPPVDFEEVVERLDDMLVETQEVDQRDRLDAARALARRMRDEEPRAQRIVLAYLQNVVEIEERSRAVEVPALYEGETAVFAPGGAVVEEELLGEDAGAARDAADDEPSDPEGSVVDRLQRARDLRDAGDLAAALAELEACLERPCYAEVVDTWEPIRDAYVSQQREQAGVLFLRARDEADPAVRLQALTDIRQRLADLVDRYPKTQQADDLRRHVELVQRAVEEAARASGAGDGDPPAEP
jgi:hypothetical protein